jgi:RNA polymerase sigma-70 factor (ECF subfamily)
MVEPAGDPLVQGLADGREEAFAALYDRFGPALFQTARVILRSGPDAEDAVQEVFIGLVRARKELARVQNMRAYLFASLRRAAARIRASHKNAQSLPVDDVLQDKRATQSDADLSMRLQRAVLALPDEQRELIALKLDGGLTFAEIASVLAISPNTAASRYRYALEKLRTSLQR